MRNRSFIHLILACFILILTSNSCKQLTARNSADVNDAIIFHHKKLMASVTVYVTELDAEVKDKIKIQEARAQLVEATEEGLVALGEMESPACNEQFIPSAKKIFQFYQDAANKEYLSIERFYIIDSLTPAQYDSLQMEVTDFKTKQQNADAAFLESQQVFAKDCGFKCL